MPPESWLMSSSSLWSLVRLVLVRFPLGGLIRAYSLCEPIILQSVLHDLLRDNARLTHCLAQSQRRHRLSRADSIALKKSLVQVQLLRLRRQAQQDGHLFAHATVRGPPAEVVILQLVQIHLFVDSANVPPSIVIVN